MATAIPIQRFPWADEAPSSIGSSSISNVPNKKWRNWLPLFVALVFIAEISFMSKIDLAEQANLVNSWADSFYQFTKSSRPPLELAVDEAELGVLVNEVDQGFIPGGCEEWLEREDSLAFSRDFDKEPIIVHGREEKLKSCAVGCKFGTDPDKKPDGEFDGEPPQRSSFIRPPKRRVIENTSNINLKLIQDRNSALAQAQQDGCTGNFRIFDSPFGNFLVPVIPTPAELDGSDKA